MQSRTRTALLVAIAMLAVILSFWSGAGRGTPADPGAAPDAARANGGPAEVPRLPRLLARRALAAEGGPAQAPIIDSITLEKQRICVGEENLVTVVAHTPGNVDDAYLYINLAGQSGTRIPLVGYPADLESQGEPRTLTVVGRNGTMVEAELPPFTVDDCAVPSRLRIRDRLLPNTIDEIELRAEVIELGSKQPFEPVRYRWDFGDGTSEVSERPILSHDFRRKRQDRLESSFLVTCTAISRSGEEIVGRVSISRPSRGFENLAYKGVVILEQDLYPRFPRFDSRGDVHQDVTMWHSYHKAVHLSRVVRRQHRTDGGPLPAPEQLDPARLLRRSVIRPGERIDFPVEFETSRAENIAFVEYQIEGVTEDGRPVAGNFAVMRPPAEPGPETGDAVVDPLLAARIAYAQRVLGQDQVTDEDLLRLEREGAFEGLQPVPGYRPPKGVPLPK